VQKEFDQNKSLQLDDFEKRLETEFERAMEKHLKNLESSYETEATIMEKILRFYNAQLICKQGETKTENTYSSLFLIMGTIQYAENAKKFGKFLSQSGRQAKQQVVSPSRSLWRAFKSIFIETSDKNTDAVWKELKGNLQWFMNDKNEDKNKKIFTEIWNGVLPKFEEDLLTLNPKTVQYLFQFIENVMNSQCITNDPGRLEKPMLCSDLVVIGLNIIINKAIDKEKSDYDSNIQNSTNEIKECKENLLKQFNTMKDSFDLGKTLAETIGKQIIGEIGTLLQRRIEKEITEDIFQSQFINHEAIQKQAYEESISQANGENILKYVYDINRYFVELSLREIKTTVNAVTHKHTLNLQDLILLAINKANSFVQESTYTETGILREGIRKAILSLPDLNLEKSADVELFRMFSLSNVVCMPIKDKKRFKKGFSSIRDYYNDIEKQVNNLTKI
jgi:hypothetical protein